MNTLLKAYEPNFSMVNILANSLLFNVSWLVIVSTHSPVIAPAVVILHLLVHFSLMGRGMAEAQLVLGVTLLGLFIDQVLFASKVFTISGAASSAPLWISCLWPVLATTLMHAFSGLQKRLLLAAIVGAIGGAMSYLAGTRLTDVEFASSLWGPLTMALLWGLVFPALLMAARLKMTTGDQTHAD